MSESIFFMVPMVVIEPFYDDLMKECFAQKLVLLELFSIFNSIERYFGHLTTPSNIY